VLDVPSILATHSSSYEVPHQLTDETVDLIMQSTAAGVSSKALGQMLGKDPSYTRHIRSKVQRGLWTESRRAQLFIEDGRVRFSKERRPGIPVNIVVDEDFAILMGYFCAEGSILETAERPNSYNIIFAFGLHEANLAEETCRILAEKFGVRPQIIIRDTTLGVAVGKTSLALLIRALCGTGSERKVVPQIILNSPPQIASAFLKAYVRGDGHRRGDGKINITTKSRALAEGTAWLVLCLGHLPSIYENEVPTERLIEGRTLQQTPIQFSVVWYDHDSTVARKFITTDDYYLVPVRSVQFEQYAGDVYNLEVEHEHNYLANFLLVSNCQNWEISQHGRDAEAGRDPLVTTAHDLVKLGKARQVRGIASTYNEPLITSEWAVSVFKEARQAGLRTMFISNGNGTPEVINYLRPHLDGYKIDLKSMQDRLYRQLGGVLQHILDTIRIVKESGLWLEVVTLVIPGFNDSKEELWDAARYIRSVSPDIPWHVTAFHPDYRMTDPARTTAEMLIRAAEIGAEAGLNYVYAGNLPGQVGEWEHTHCPHCRTILIKRYGFYVMEDKLTKTGGKCPKCGTQIPGVWA
jgi:pyruvate formate lyase activating enzyme